MFDLDTLYKKYLFYRFKKLLVVLLLVCISVGAVYLFFSFQEDTKNSAPIQKEKVKNLKSRKKSQKEQEQVSSKEAKHYKIFTLSVKEKSRAYIEKMKQKYLKLGLQCQIEDQNNYLNLVCGETNSYKEYQKIKTLLKKNHIKYYVVIKKEIPISDKKEVQESTLQTPKRAKKVESLINKDSVQKKETNRTTLANIRHSDVDVELLEKKFLEHKSYEIAIRIAKEYYAQQRYEKSLLWAKEANHLNRKKEQSWILYARSLYVLGEKEKAIKILKLYKHFASSKKVERILQRWQSNDK